MIRNLHRKLVLRLVVGALAIAGVFGVGVYYYEIEKIDEAIVESVAAEAKLLGVEIKSHMPIARLEKDQDLEADLSAFLGRHRALQDGSFIIAELYDTGRNKLAEAVFPEFEWVEAKLKTNRHQFPISDSSYYRRIYLDDKLFVQALTPIRNDQGGLEGYLEGVYEVSQERMAEIEDLIFTSLTLVVLSVLATALLLYPVIRLQQKSLVALNQDLLTANAQTLEMLGSAIAKRDSDTNAHNFRVVIYAVNLAQAVDMPPSEIHELIKGSFLHDIGKIAIPDRILLKPGKLDEAEFAIMKTHVNHGVDIVRHSTWLAEAKKVVHSHHEKYNGSGYPNGLQGEDIPLSARIFAIADVFDALTSTRPYKQAFSLEKALNIMKEGSGSHFDPVLLAAFEKLVSDLHLRFAGREDETVENAARNLAAPYFEI